MLTLAWDIDDVLNDLMGTWLETWWRPAHGRCTVPFAGLTENPPCDVLGVTLPEYLASLDEFRLGEFARLAPRPEVLAWFESHGHRFRHIAVTAVPLRCAPASAAWLMKHFGRWIRTFHVVPSHRAEEEAPSYDLDKETFLARAGAVTALIDDNATHIAGAERAGVRGLLFPQPWNRSPWTVAALLDELTRL